MTKKNRLLMDAVFVAFAIFIVFAPLFLFDQFTSATDHFIHYRWASQFYESLTADIWMPSWEASSRGALGDPVFVYYAPAFYYFVALANVLFDDVWLSIKLIILITSTILAITILIFARRRNLNDFWARGVMIIAITSPMSFGIWGLINAYPWFIASVVLIFSVISTLRVLERGSLSDHAWLAVAIFSVAMIHTLTVLMYAFVLLISAVIISIREKLRGGIILKFIKLGIAITFGLILASVSLLPAISTLNLITPSSLLHSPLWSVTWENSFIIPIVTKDYRFAISYLIPIMSLAILICGLCIYYFERPVGLAINFLMVASVVSFLLASEVTYPLWASFEPLRFVQRPFRFLTPLNAIQPILLMCLLAKVSSGGAGKERVARRLAMALVALSVLCILALHVNTVYRIHKDVNLSQPATPASRAQFYETPEHLPRGAGSRWKDFLEQGGWEAFCAAQDLSCRSTRLSPEHFVWTVVSAAPIEMKYPLMAFPAWQVNLNGTHVPTVLDPDTGLLTVSLPKGENVVEVQWRRLPEQRQGAFISLALMILCAAVIAWRFFSPKLGSHRSS